jgi:hypothetical protein
MRARIAKALMLVTLASGCGERAADLDVEPNVVDRARLGNEVLFVDASRNEVDAVDVMQVAPTSSVQRIAVRANPRFVVERSGGLRRAAVAPNAGSGGTSADLDPLGLEPSDTSRLPPEEVLILSDGNYDAGGDYIDVPSLTVINRAHAVRHYPLSMPLGQLLLSSDGHYALLWGESTTGNSDKLLRDPNRVALVNLDEDASNTNPVERTLKTTGSAVTAALITPPLKLVNRNGELEPRALALFSFNNGLSVWDLAHPDREEITVQGLSASNQFQLKRLVADPDNAQLYLIQRDEADLRVLSFGQASAAAENDFWPSWNLLRLGLNTASDMVLYTEASVPKVLVAAGRQLAIVDANNSLVDSVALAAGGEKMVSFIGASPNDNDPKKQRVLVWGVGNSTVSFVELANLKKAGAQNIEQLPLGYPLANLIRLSGNLMLTVLSGGGIGTLDLDSRRFRPLASKVVLGSPRIESDARRVWVGANINDNRVAFFEPATLATGSLRLDSVVQDLFLFENGEDRRVVATHASPIGELTIVDGKQVTRKSSRVLTGFLVDGLVNR